MKRSEMLETLASIWLELNFTKEEALDIVSSVLIEVEKAGMVPPKRKGALVGLDGIPVHAWEPEEEVVTSLPFGNSNVGFIENLHIGSEFTPESIGLECPVIKNYNRPDYDIFD